jgi:hypothetical protein
LALSGIFIYYKTHIILVIKMEMSKSEASREKRLVARKLHRVAGKKNITDFDDATEVTPQSDKSISTHIKIPRFLGYSNIVDEFNFSGRYLTAQIASVFWGGREVITIESDRIIGFSNSLAEELRRSGGVKEVKLLKLCDMLRKVSDDLKNDPEGYKVLSATELTSMRLEQLHRT